MYGKWLIVFISHFLVLLSLFLGKLYFFKVHKLAYVFYEQIGINLFFIYFLLYISFKYLRFNKIFTKSHFSFFAFYMVLLTLMDFYLFLKYVSFLEFLFIVLAVLALYITFSLLAKHEFNR